MAMGKQVLAVYEVKQGANIEAISIKLTFGKYNP